nr:hypothetical protein [Brucella intermedia]
MADEIIALRPRTLGFLGDGAEIDEIIILFAVHDYLHSLSIAAECSIMKASEALPDQRRDKAPDMGALWVIRSDKVELLAGVVSLSLQNQYERSSPLKLPMAALISITRR